MNAFWAYFWPVFGIGAIIGILAGSIGFRAPRVSTKAGPEIHQIAIAKWRRRQIIALVIGVAGAIGAASLWHGPLGAADRFARQVERSARDTLDEYEMTKVTAHVHHHPLTRQVILAGPADDFQSSELVRIIGDLPGVSGAQWTAEPGDTPLILEGIAVCVLGFLFGLLLAYLVELRRRYNAQWNW